MKLKEDYLYLGERKNDEVVNFKIEFEDFKPEDLHYWDVDCSCTEGVLSKDGVFSGKLYTNKVTSTNQGFLNEKFIHFYLQPKKTYYMEHPSVYKRRTVDISKQKITVTIVAIVKN